MSRLGLLPLGFGDTIVLLTAVHFHFAGFAAPLIASLAGERIGHSSNLLRFATITMILAALAVALGITLFPWLELIAALWLSIGMMALSSVLLRDVRKCLTTRPSRILITIAAVSVWPSMALASAFAIGEFLERGPLDIPLMSATHGWLNGMGFAICGLLSFRRPLLTSVKPA